MSDFIFGQHSRDKLLGVNPNLVDVVIRALSLSDVDFGITEGLRSPERQAELVAAGKSRAPNGKHTIGHAVDVAAFVDGAFSWEWPYYPQIAAAFRQASIELDIPIVWGGYWGRQLAVLDADLAQEAENYQARFKVEHPGRKPLVDGPHFELRMDPGLPSVTTT